MNKNWFASAVLAGVTLFAAQTAFAALPLATCWHIPDSNTEPNLLGANMRSPEFEIGTSNIVTIYSGVWKWSNSVQILNQTGGWLVYKGATQSSWSSNALNWYTNTAANQYWLTSLNTTNFGTNEVIQYYLYLTFDSGAQNTFIYGGDAGSSITATESVARTNSFTIRNRPAWLFHSNNRVFLAGSDASHVNVQVWVKAGYIGKDNSVASRYADHGAVYFTLDGSAPGGSLGTASGTAQAVALSFDHTENNSSPAGNAMWWMGTISNAPLYSVVKYKVGLWNSANNEEKFAEYNAGVNNSTFSFTNGTVGDPILTVNGVNADYTTTHVFVDEVAGDAIPLTILFSPNTANITEADVFSNVNRRDRATLDADGDGVEDGIIPPNGNLILTNNDSNYYKAYLMTNTGTPGQFGLTLYVQKTGAYRLTARYKVSGNTNWFWYSGGSTGRRDHALVVTPTKARNITLYELNAMNINSQGTNFSDRSTFTDLYNGPGSRSYDPVTNRFNLNYMKNLGVNWLWFQPIHPIGVLNRQNDPDTGSPYEVGSPYSVKNFFQIDPLLGKTNTRDEAMQEFTNFVAAADTAGVSVMLDAAFNHTSWDCELDASGVYYFKTNAQPTDVISGSEARFYSRSGEYDQRASSAANVAQAPDRYDFGKWSDVADIYFGRYAALVPNSSSTTSYTDEGDWFDYTIGDENSVGSGNGHFDQITQNTWRYFSDYVLYWLDKTGCPTGTAATNTYHGIDGLRADFGQGLPPQCWEYIINKVRSRKWDFVFMSESLDGGAVTYRSNRHFDMLNENIVFALKSASTATDYRNVFEGRRTSYGQGLVLLNTTSHDEEGYDDPYLGFIRYSVAATIDGAPMIFYGQELGSSRLGSFQRYELNFGKEIVHFKKYNSMQPLLQPSSRTNGQDYLFPIYSGINQARQFSRALRSSSRYFINQNDGTPQASIYSVAKYEAANASPNLADVVFAFATLDRNTFQSGVYNVNITQNGANLFGIQSNRTYNVKNIAAYTGSDSNRRNYWLWGGSGKTGSNILTAGIYVGLNPVPSSDAGWTNAPFEAQYLKLYDITPPPAPGTPTAPAIVNSTSATFNWSGVTDSVGGISGYHLFVGTTPGGSNIFNGIVSTTSNTVAGSYGQTLYAFVTAVNNAGIEGAASSVSSGTSLVFNHPPVAGTNTYQRGVGVPLHILISDLLTNATDADNDTISFAGLNLLTTNGVTLVTNSTHIFYTNAANWNDSFNYYISDNHGGSATGLVLIQVVSVASNNTVLQLQTGVPGLNTNTVTFAGVPGYQYVVQFTTNLNSGLWFSLATNIAATNGLWQVVDPTATNKQRYYRSFLPLTTP